VNGVAVTVAGARLRRDAPGLYYWPERRLWLVRTRLYGRDGGLDWVALAAGNHQLARELAHWHNRGVGYPARLREQVNQSWQEVHNSLRALVRALEGPL
jgi:hypothetical protein